MSITSYRDLTVWQKSMNLVEKLYQITEHFPQTEIYGLTNQLRRAAVSVPSNIAEGSAKRSRKEFARFINMASGSTAEIETQLLLAERLKFLGSNDASELLEQTKEISRMPYALHRSLNTKPEPLTQY